MTATLPGNALGSARSSSDRIAPRLSRARNPISVGNPWIADAEKPGSCYARNAVRGIRAIAMVSRARPLDPYLSKPIDPQRRVRLRPLAASLERVNAVLRRKVDNLVDRNLLRVEGVTVLRRLLRSSLTRIYSKRDADEDRALFEGLKSRNFMPHAVQIQVSRACNLRCAMCGWSVWQRNRGFMKIELFAHILSELRLNGIKNVWLSNPQGEPLISPHALTCIEMAISRGFDVILNTNCTTLSDKKINDLVEQATSGRLVIQASFSGHDKVSYEFVYVGSRFELTSSKLKSLNERLRERGLERFLVVNGVLMDAAALPKTLAYLEMLGITRDRVTVSLPDNFAGLLKSGPQHRQTGIHSYKQSLPYRSFRLCHHVACHILMYDDGKVSACASRDSEGAMVVGDITKRSLLSILNGSPFMDMMDAFMKRDLQRLPFCRGCDVPYGNRDHDQLIHSGQLVTDRLTERALGVGANARAGV